MRLLQNDAARQQVFASIIAVICLTGIILLTTFSLEVPPILEGIATLAVGFLLGNVKTNGVVGSKAAEASESLAAAVAAKVSASNQRDVITREEAE